MIGKLLFAGVVAATVGYGYPLWNEHASTACRAVESRFFAMALPPSHPGRLLELAVARTYLEPLSHGRVAASQAKQRYPAVPAEIGCAVGYWASLLDPRVQQAVRTAVR
jgi:hypothetical protein